MSAARAREVYGGQCVSVCVYSNIKNKSIYVTKVTQVLVLFFSGVYAHTVTHINMQSHTHTHTDTHTSAHPGTPQETISLLTAR